MKGSIIGTSIIELVLAGIVILIGAFFLSNLFGGSISSDDRNIFTIRDIASYSNDLPSGKCASIDDFFIDQGFRIEKIENKLNLVKEKDNKILTELKVNKNFYISDQDKFNTINNDFPINIDFSEKIEKRTCLCNNDGIIKISLMPYQYGIASGCGIAGDSLSEAVF